MKYYRPVNISYLLITILVNIGAIFHLRLRKNSMVQQELNRISDPAVPSVQRRYNPVIIHSMAWTVLLFCFLATLITIIWEKYGLDVLLDAPKLTSKKYVYFMQLTVFMICVTAPAVCFFTKKPLRNHVRSRIVCLKISTVSPQRVYETNN